MATEISTIKPLDEGTVVTNGQVAIYTVPASTKATIKFISLHNTHASTDETITIWLVPSGEAVGTAYQRYKQTVYAGKTFDIHCSFVVNADTDFYIEGSVGSISSVQISGFEITNAS